MNALATFSYGSLDASLAASARSLAADLHKFQRRTTEEAHGLGRRLLNLREQIDEGLFVRWIEEETGVGRSSAYRMMALAERFDEAAISHVGKLGPTVAYALAQKSTPDAFRSDIVSRITKGETVVPETVRYLIRDAQREAQRDRVAKAKRENRKLANDPAHVARQAARAARENRKSEQLRAAREAEMRSAVDIVLAALGDDQLVTLLRHLDAGNDYSFRYAVRSALHEVGRLPEIAREASAA